MPSSPQHTGYDVRLVEEWLNAQFVSGYCEYDPSDGTFRLTDEQAAVLADDSTPAFLAGAMTIAARDLQGRGEHPQRVRDRPWPRLARALPRPVPRHRASLQAGLPRQPRVGVDPGARRRRGQVAGRSARSPTSGAVTARPRSCSRSSIPNSEIVGFDYHQGSIDTARKRAAEAGVADRVKFEVASAQDFPGNRLRPRVHLRRAPRHGRPRRSSSSHP